MIDGMSVHSKVPKALQKIKKKSIFVIINNLSGVIGC